MSEWKPIDSAPNGVDLIIYYSGVISIAFYDVTYKTWITEGCETLNNPSHWMPLPKPPK